MSVLRPVEPIDSAWSPEGWRGLRAEQQPTYSGDLEGVLARMRTLPPLVTLGEIDRLRAHLATVAEGRAFLLQGGDCAESFGAVSGPGTERFASLVEEMRAALTYGRGLPVVAVGRIAGQYAKPRSSPTERVGGQELPSYRGDIVNRMEACAEARVARADNLLSAYWHAAATLNFLRATVGAQSSQAVVARLLAFVERSSQGRRFLSFIEELARASRYAELRGGLMGPARGIFTSHEGLILPFEEALLRQDEASGRWYGGSAHFLWIGERTRQLEGAHVELCRGLANPIGVKLGPTTEPDYLARLIERLNPEGEPGRLTLISRMGWQNVRTKLPPLVRSVRARGFPVIWSCDPMHGNTVKSPNGYKTRHFRDVLEEVRGFFEVHAAEGTHVGGLHLEMTGEDVTECAGGAEALTEMDLSDRYHTHCDPRLNYQQALELALLVSTEHARP